jgi:hypothetical protein
MYRTRHFALLAILLSAAGVLGGAWSALQAQHEALFAAPAQEPAATPAHVWLGPDGQPLPFKSDEELLEFLRTAKVMSVKGIGKGITAPEKVVLEKNGVRANAHFNFVSEDKPVAVLRTGETVMNFRDSHTFQSAAYELAQMLGLDNVPPVVPRRVGGRSGSLSIWIENSFTERERLSKKTAPPDSERFNRQVAIMRLFDALIFNTDRTQENILIGSDWKLWMIDHTRAFRREDTIPEQSRIVQCERNLWKKLQSLDAAQVRARLKDYLRGPEIDGVLKRHAKLVAHIQSLIQQRGEDGVLFDMN